MSKPIGLLIDRGVNSRICSHCAEEKNRTHADFPPKRHLQLASLPHVSRSNGQVRGTTNPVYRHCQNQAVDNNVRNRGSQSNRGALDTMTCDRFGGTPEVGKPTGTLKRTTKKGAKEPGHNNADHAPRSKAESSTAEDTSIEENDRKLHGPESPGMY